MIGITVEELYPFLGVYTLYTMFFATAFMILEVELDVTEPDLLKSSYPTGPRLRRSSMESYPGIGKMYAYLLYAFRNSIGDLAIPNYDSWLLSRQEG